MITPQNALKLSMWLAVTHPAAFQAVLNQTLPPTQHRLRRGLGALRAGGPVQGTYIPGARNRGASRKAVPASLARGRFGALGDVTDSSTLEEFTPTVQPMFDDPILSDINVDIAPTSTFDLGSAAAASDTSGGFWSSIGSGLSSIGGGLASAVGSVAGVFLNPQTLSAAGNLAATVIKANGANAQQQALLQTQIQRTATGSGVQAVRYAVNPATGQTVPMYYNPQTGQYQPSAPTQSVFGSLFTPSVPGAPSTIGTYIPYLLIGGGIILVAVMMKSR